MNIKELIGKEVIRTAPVNYGNGREDYSYTTESLRILAATEHHIVIEHPNGILKGHRSILDSRWNDENWADYRELMRLADETKTTMGDSPSSPTGDKSDSKDNEESGNDSENDSKSKVVLN